MSILSSILSSLLFHQAVKTWITAQGFQNEPASQICNIVGPICETGDVLARGRGLPEASSGDLILITNCGAYGASMASNYNMRSPAPANFVLNRLDAGQAQRFLSVYGAIGNLFRLGRHLMRASHYREFRGRAFAEWQLATRALQKRELNKLSMLLIQDR